MFPLVFVFFFFKPVNQKSVAGGIEPGRRSVPPLFFCVSLLLRVSCATPGVVSSPSPQIVGDGRSSGRASRRQAAVMPKQTTITNPPFASMLYARVIGAFAPRHRLRLKRFLYSV